MRVITNPTTFRENVQKMLFKHIENEKMCINLEKGIFNKTIEVADENNIIKKWDNKFFTTLYENRLRSIMINLKTNTNLVEQILEKKIKAHKLAYMSHQDMNYDKWSQLIEDKKIKDENRYTLTIEASTDNFTCRKCKSNKCSYYQLQTRSADEPMTTFVTCINCGSRWKC